MLDSFTGKNCCHLCGTDDIDDPRVFMGPAPELPCETLDTLIARLEEYRTQHGGQMKVYIGMIGELNYQTGVGTGPCNRVWFEGRPSHGPRHIALSCDGYDAEYWQERMNSKGANHATR